MYLPSWVVAALAVFRAANMPDSESSLHIAEQGQLRTTAMNKFSFLAEKHDMAKMCLGVTDSKEGEVVKLIEVTEPQQMTVWELKSTSSYYLVQLLGTDLCLTAKTKKVKDDDDEETEVGVAGDITLQKCASDDPDWDHPAVGGYWYIENLGMLRQATFRLGYFSELAISHDMKKKTVAGVLDHEHSDDKLLRAFPFIEK